MARSDHPLLCRLATELALDGSTEEIPLLNVSSDVMRKVVLFTPLKHNLVLIFFHVGDRLLRTSPQRLRKRASPRG